MQFKPNTISLLSWYPKSTQMPLPQAGSISVPHPALTEHAQFRAGHWSRPSSLLGTARCAHPTLPRSTGTSSILVGEVGKAPDVAQAHGIAHHGQQVIAFSGPVSTLCVLIAVTGVGIFFSCQAEVLGREEGMLAITHQARKSITPSFHCPETYLEKAGELEAPWEPLKGGHSQLCCQSS